MCANRCDLVNWRSNPESVHIFGPKLVTFSSKTKGPGEQGSVHFMGVIRNLHSRESASFCDEISGWFLGAPSLPPPLFYCWKKLAFWHYRNKERVSRGLDVRWHVPSTCLDASKRGFYIGSHSMNRPSDCLWLETQEAGRMDKMCAASGLEHQFSEEAMGGWKKEGGGDLTNDTPPKKGFWTPPLVRYVFHPPQVSVLCFSCTEIHDRADQELFWRGPTIFGRARSLVRFPPPIRYAPPISRPKICRRLF